MGFFIFDAHCDTILAALDTNQNLYENNCHIDFKRLSLNHHIQVFAAFVDKVNDLKKPYLRANELIDFYHKQISEYSDFISHCNSFDDIKNTVARNKIASLLSIEGGEALDGKIKNIEHFYKKGVRILTLCWNYKNELCDGIGVESGKGLTYFGINVLEKMNELGMLADVSHISEAGFWDVITLAKHPITASHSNAYSLMPNNRNLNDEQIKAIISNNGCIGINFYTQFLSKDNCNISTILKHIEYILALGGENNIGFGSDFDGMSMLPCEISGVEDFFRIIDAMQKIGYSDELIKKICYGNFLRLIKDVLK
jgi:membrane dipeptidase